MVSLYRWPAWLMMLLLTASVVNADSITPSDDWIFPTSIDPQLGVIKTRTPMRRSWLQDGVMTFNPRVPGKITFSNGAVLNPPTSFNYAFSSDPAMREILRVSGTVLAPPISLEQYLQEQFIPNVSQTGYRYLRHYPLEEIEDRFRDEDIASYFPDYSAQFTAFGTEWEAPNGNKAFALLVQNVSSYFDGQENWVVMVQELQAPNAVFDQAKADFIFTQAKRQVNPQWILARAQQLGVRLDLQKAEHDHLMQQSQQAHWQRMNSIQQRGQAATNIAKTYSEISDINHAGFMNSSNMVASGHEKTMLAIGENTMIRSADTAEAYIVPDKGAHVWVNKSGEYISTDNSNFDPRTMQSISQLQWTQFEKVE